MTKDEKNFIEAILVRSIEFFMLKQTLFIYDDRTQKSLKNNFHKFN